MFLWAHLENFYCRFLDIVSHQAGKLEALEHVRKSHGFDKDATIACGDSGNDILMLAGEKHRTKALSI